MVEDSNRLFSFSMFFSAHNFGIFSEFIEKIDTNNWEKTRHHILNMKLMQLQLIFQVLAEIRPYLSGTGGGLLEFVQISDYVVKVRLSGPAAGVMTVRVALTQKLREKIPSIAAVQLID